MKRNTNPLGKITKQQLSKKLINELIEGYGGGASSIEVNKFTTIIDKEVSYIPLPTNFSYKDALLVFRNGVYIENTRDYIINIGNSIIKPDGSSWEVVSEAYDIFNIVNISEKSSLIEFKKETIILNENTDSFRITGYHKLRDNIIIFKNGVYLCEDEYTIDEEFNVHPTTSAQWETDEDASMIFNIIYFCKDSSLVDFEIKREKNTLTENLYKIPIEKYEKDRDDILVFINGVYLEYGYDYIINPDKTISKVNGSLWIGSTNIPTIFEIVYISRDKYGLYNTNNKVTQINNTMTINIRESEWSYIKETDTYVYLFNHRWSTRKILVRALDKEYKSVMLSYDLSNLDTIKFEIVEPLDCEIIIVNTDSNVE